LCGIVVCGIVACGASARIGREPNEPSTRPEAAGAAQHRAAARREEGRLARHQALYDPKAQQSVRRSTRRPSPEPPANPFAWSRPSTQREAGFAIDIEAEDSEAGREIWRRAQLLASVN